jgi:hypothetical protein
MFLKVFHQFSFPDGWKGKQTRVSYEMFFLKKEVARGGEQTRVLSISFIFSFFTTLPLSHSGSPSYEMFVANI